jgi:hypothetical protein
MCQRGLGQLQTRMRERARAPGTRDSTRRARSAAQGGRKENFNQKRRDISSWFDKAPGLNNEIALLAWTHYGDSPLIDAT